MTHVTVMDWQRVLLYVDGRLDRVLEPGRYRYRKGRSTLVTVDMRPRSYTLAGQELLTRDGLAVKVSVVVTWTVTDPVAYVVGAESAGVVLHVAVQDAVRALTSAATLDEIIADRELLSNGMREAVAERTAGIGIAVSEARARDLMLPGELRRAAQETLLARERGRADLERARAEAASLRTLANAARLLEQHPSLLQLRTLQVAAEPGTRVVLDSRTALAAGTDGGDD